MPKKKITDPADKIEKARADLEAARLALVAAEAGITLPPRSAGVSFADYVANVKHDLAARMDAMRAAIALLDEMLGEQHGSQHSVSMSTSRSYGVTVSKSSNGQAEG